MTGGTLTVSNGLTNASGGTMSISSGATLSTSGALTNNSNTSGGLTIDGTLTETGTTAISNTGAITLAGGTLSDTGTGGISNTSTGTITSSGTSSLEGGTGNTSNAGILDVTAGTLSVTGALTDSGSSQINISSGAALTTSGTITNTAGTITLTGGTLGTGTVSNAATITGYGTVSANVTGSGGTITANGPSGGGTLDVTGTVVTGQTFTIGTTNASTLEFSNTAATAAAISITNANQTLEIGSGALTINAAETVSGGKIQMAGGSLTDGSGLTLGSGATAGTLTGFGTVVANVSKGGSATTNTITASAGTLEIDGTATSIDSLTVGSGATDKLKLDGVSSATSVTFSGNTGTLELNTAGTLTLTDFLAIGANTVQLDGAGSTLTDTAGVIQISTGTITGLGTVTGGITASGAADITASGGTLEIANYINNNGTLALTVGSGATDRLKLDDHSAATSLTFLGGTGTLELNTAVTLTLTSALAIGANTVQLDGAGSTLTDTAANTIAGGTISGLGTLAASTNFTGHGTVSIPVSNASTLTASGGTLDVQGTVGSSATLEIASGASNVLQLDGSVAAGTAVSFLGAAGTHGVLDITSAPGTFQGTISMNVGSDALVADNDDIQFGSNTVTSASLAGSTLTVVAGGNTYNLTLASTPPGVPTPTGPGAMFLSTAACYCRGTLILTETGEVAVEALKIGDRVMTISGEAEPIKWIGRRSYQGRLIAGSRWALPVRIRDRALADGVPARDLFISPAHALYIDGVLVEAESLLDGATIAQAQSIERVEYFHIELAAHHVIFAEGAPAETYIDTDNRGIFDNASEYAARFMPQSRAGMAVLRGAAGKTRRS